MHAEGHIGEAPHPVEHPHPGPRTYIVIAVILAVITAIEVAIYYIPELIHVLVPILLLLSIAKFCLVVMFFMHLKFDTKLFTAFFVSGLLLAISVIIAFLALFDNFAPHIGPSH